MTILQQIKRRILRWLGLERLSDDPASRRYDFINSEETVRRQRLEECRIWYVGDSDELENFYTGRNTGGNAEEPIYNRNKWNYFWSRAVKGDEQPAKKVHSGVPHAIVDTLCNVIGCPTVSAPGKDDEIRAIEDANDFARKLTQEARPLTLVEGWGAWKVLFDKSISDRPSLQYYEGKDVDFVVRSGVLMGILYKDYYKSKGEDYVLLETRRITKEGDSVIEYELFRYSKSGDAEQVPLSTLDDTASLPEDGLVIPGLKKVLGVPCRYFYDVFSKDYGRSIFEGKIDVFDDIDQCLSQASQTDRVSTPVEYYPVEFMQKGADGQEGFPQTYNRQYVKLPALADGDGRINATITTTQPQLNFAQYSERYKSLLDVALTGILSPASMGIDVSRRDNADAQREKEKVTLFTRSNVIDSETRQLKELFRIALMVQDYMDTGSFPLEEPEVSVKYGEFANPSFENLSRVLLPLLTSGGISPAMYVERLYGDSLSSEEKAKEVAAIEERMKADSTDVLSELMGENATAGDGE